MDSQWFSSYLNDRCQYVKLGDKQSTLAFVLHGIPQGSIVCPLLFITFINDLPSYVTTSEIDLYADDTTSTSSINYHGSIERLQNTLNSSIAEIDRLRAVPPFPLPSPLPYSPPFLVCPGILGAARSL